MNRFQLSRRHLSRQHLSWQHLSISGISQLLLTQFWPKFKYRFLDPSSTDANCHGDIICPSNIYPVNICPYRNISAFSDPILTKLFRTKFLGKLFFLPKYFFAQNIFWPKILFDPNFFEPKIIFNKNSFWHKLCTQNFVEQNFLLQNFFWIHFFWLNYSFNKFLLTNIFLLIIYLKQKFVSNQISNLSIWYNLT